MIIQLCLFFLAQFIHALDQHEDGKSNDHEIDTTCQVNHIAARDELLELIQHGRSSQ